MLQTALEAFEDSEIEEREAALKESLAAGIRNDTVAVEIIEHEDWNFKKAMDFAMKKESSISARKEMSTNPECQEITILKVDEKGPPPRPIITNRTSPSAQNLRNGDVNRTNDNFKRSSNDLQFKRCYNCNKQGHLAANCKERKACYYCGKPGHIKKACFALQRNKAQNRQNGQIYSARPYSPMQLSQRNFPAQQSRQWSDQSQNVRANQTGPSPVRGDYRPTTINEISKN